MQTDEPAADAAEQMDAPKISPLGRNLRRLLQQAGVGQNAFAERIGVSKSVISMLLSGKNAGASEETINRAAAELGCSVALLTRIDEGPAAAPHAMIRPSPLNPRRVFDAQDLRELADSIDRHGLLQNLIVRPDPDGDGYLVIGGERRWRAIGMLIDDGRWPADRPVNLHVAPADDDQHLVLAIIENLQRKDIPPLDEARALRNLHATGWDTQTIADKIGKTDRHVQLRLALLDRLSPAAQDALAEERILLAHARALTATFPAAQEYFLPRIGASADLRTADDLTNAIRRMAPAARAEFDLDEFRTHAGDVLTDTTGAQWLPDFAAFMAWQDDAIYALPKKLAAEGHAHVAVHWSDEDHGFTPAAPLPLDRRPPVGSWLTAVVLVDAETRAVTIHRRQVVTPPADEEPQADDPRLATAPDSGDEDEDRGDEDDAVPRPAAAPKVADLEEAELRARADACAVRTRALQAALQKTPDCWMIALALGMIGDRSAVNIAATPDFPQNVVVAPSVRAELEKWRTRLGGDDLFDEINDAHPYLRLHPRAPEDAGARIAWELFVDTDTESLVKALVASRCAARYLPGRANVGDAPATIALAEMSDADVATDAGDGAPWEGDIPATWRFGGRAEIEIKMRDGDAR